MSDESVALSRTTPAAFERVFTKNFAWFQKILFFGPWEEAQHDGEQTRRSRMQYSALETSFTGATVEWVGFRGPEHGLADVFIDGELQETVDNYASEPSPKVVKFRKTGISGDRIHTIRVVVRKDRNPAATDCYQDVVSIRSAGSVSYVAELTKAMAEEYDEIQRGARSVPSPDTWSPVADAASPPAGGVSLGGVLGDLFQRNIDYLNHCFASPTYCDGEGWSEWLPASNEGRMLSGAGNTLRWGERGDMRKIVDTIVDDIESRMRDDGYYNYYNEENSYALLSTNLSERKNYDRVFWTRGLLAAGAAGNPKAYDLLRRMYDWFNASPYIAMGLVGGNATNGLPGGPLMALSPAGKPEDLLATQQYYDQRYWMNELANAEPLAISHYPGERPHCYELLALEAFVDEYRATGDRTYLDAARGGWKAYRDSFTHIGGATTICENGGPYPPQSAFITTGHNGELCGSVFWIFINSKLMHLFPLEEKYAAEIERSLYNVILACTDQKGYKRYHCRLHGTKHSGSCIGNCCEVSATGLIASMPELIYSIGRNGIHVNLFAASTITWECQGVDVALRTETDFPLDPEVSIRLSTPGSVEMTIWIRVPSWAAEDMPVFVNDAEIAKGTPGGYLAIQRTWSDGDTIRFTLPAGLTPVKYTGLDQVEGNLDRHALLYGPILMALCGELDGPDGVPRLALAPDALVDCLTPEPGKPLEYAIRGYPEYRYVPYWALDKEAFTCFPIVQA